MQINKVLGSILLAAAGAWAQATIYVPDGVTKNSQITSCTGTAPTICTTGTAIATLPHGFSIGDIVGVHGIVENNGTSNQYSNLNSPPGSARKIAAAGFSATTFSLTDLAGTAVNTTNTVLPLGGFIRKVVSSTLNPPPLAGFGGKGSLTLEQWAATILDGTLTSIVVTGTNLATVHYPYPHGLSSGNSIQVRNASDTHLNGIFTVTVIDTQTLTYPVTGATNGTYTDANLSVSSRAIDGTPAWNGIKYCANTYGTATYINFIYNAGNQSSYQGMSCAALYYLVDPSQTTMRDTVVTKIGTNYEDFYPVPQMCGEVASNTSCYYDATHVTTADVDYIRIQVVYVMTCYEILRYRNLLTPTQITNFANYMLNNRDTNCVNPALNTGAGTITVSGTTVTGTGTNFSVDFPVGSYIGYYVSTATRSWARVLTVGPGETMTVTGNFGNVTNHEYQIGGNFQSNSCGVLWNYSHHIAADGSRDARLYVQPVVTGGVPVAWNGYEQNWMIIAGNNQSMSNAFANTMIASGLANDDSRALDLLARTGDFGYDYNLAEMIGSWGGINMSGGHYAGNRTQWLQFVTNAIPAYSSTAYPNYIKNGYVKSAKELSDYFIYAYIPSSGSADPHFMNYGATWTGQPASYVNYGATFASILGIAGGAEAQRFQYFLPYALGNAWTGGVSGAGVGWWTMPMPYVMFYDPNIPSTDFKTLPTQVEMFDTDGSHCASIGLHCGDGSTYTFWPSSLAVRGAIISRSAWLGSPTLFFQFSLGQNQGTSSVNDHSQFMPGAYKIEKTTGTGAASLSGCLVGDNATTCTNDDNISANIQAWRTSPSLEAGGLFIGTATNPASFGPVLSRWSGADKYGDPTSRFMASTIDLSQYFGPGTVTRADRTMVHLKEAGNNEIIALYDDVQRPTSYAIAGYTHYPQGATSGCCTGGSMTYAGGQVTSTTSDGFRILTQWLAPAGATTLAVHEDDYTYTNAPAGHMARRFTHCVSTDGVNCGSGTAMEAIETHLITDNTVSTFTSSLISPDANWGCDQIVGNLNTSTICFARNGLQGAPANFTVSCSGTGTCPVLLTGLTPGSYPVTVGGTPVTGSPFSVVAGNNTLYFEAPAGGVVSLGGSSPACSITTTSLPGGTVGTAYSQTVGTLNAVAPLTFSITSGALPPPLTIGASTGTIAGTPNTASTYNFNVHLLDNVGCTADQLLSIVVSNGVVVNVTPNTIAPGVRGVQHGGQTYAASGGTAPYSWSLSAVTGIPPGMSINASTGALTGTPTQAGTFVFDVVATDANTVSGQATVTMVVSQLTPALGGGLSVH